VARLVGDQLEQHELQLARIEEAAPPAASFAVLAVVTEAMATAMAEMAPAEMASEGAAIVRKLERVCLVGSVMPGPLSEAATMVSVVAVPVAPARFMTVCGVGESHCYSKSFYD
jgi:hypothetical protein